MRKLFIPLVCLFILGGCTEAELASHVAKQIPIPGENKSQGDFKVGNPYRIAGKWYTPQESYSYSETGIASWYGPNFHGKSTANGETFDKYELTAAHKTLQMPSLVRVTNLENGRSLVVRINDRGPFKRGRIIDLSEKAAELLGFKGQGTAKVRVQVLAKESRAIAQAARQGQDTRGIEVAMNENPRAQPRRQPISTLPPSRQPAPQPAYQQASLQPVEREVLQNSAIPGHINQGRFLPDPVVKQVPVTPTSIYVQAGSFGNQGNAARLAQSLQRFGNAQVYPANVRGQQFYRVRLGPVRDVQQADILLANLANSGQSQAIIVVD